MSKPIISVDFDGVIHGYQSGWKGAHVIPDPPVLNAIAMLLRYLDAGFDVAVFSSRSKSLRGRWAMKRWLGKAIADFWTAGNTPPSLAEAECWGDARSVVNRIQWPWFKPAALVTIDDRAIMFEGSWLHPSLEPEALRMFKPWNKKPLGATGQFPHPALDDHDEGELKFAIGFDSVNGLVRVEFGKPVAWLALPPDVAINMAKSILKKAGISKIELDS